MQQGLHGGMGGCNFVSKGKVAHRPAEGPVLFFFKGQGVQLGCREGVGKHCGGQGRLGGLGHGWIWRKRGSGARTVLLSKLLSEPGQEVARARARAQEGEASSGPATPLIKVQGGREGQEQERQEGREGLQGGYECFEFCEVLLELVCAFRILDRRPALHSPTSRPRQQVSNSTNHIQ